MTDNQNQAQPVRPLTRKQRAFVRHIITHPKDSATEAVRQTYKATGNTASQIATENLRKPNIKLELEKYLGTAEMTMLEVMEISKEYARTGTREGASYATVAVQASKDIQDRVKGKPLQRSENINRTVTLNVDLTTSMQELTGAEAEKTTTD